MPKLAIFSGHISESIYAILLKFGTLQDQLHNYKCIIFRPTSHIGYELQGGQKWPEILHVNSVQPSSVCTTNARIWLAHSVRYDKIQSCNSNVN